MHSFFVLSLSVAVILGTANAANLRSAFNSYIGRCSCGHQYSNNCAHFVSQALISAGYSDLNGGYYPSGTCNNGSPVWSYNGRVVCCAAGRPIRARELKAWASGRSDFSYSSNPPSGSGTKYCLVYQGGAGYWGGHIVLAKVVNGVKVDYRGTGWYDWPEQAYYC